MLRGQDIVCIAPQGWDSLLRRRQQIMSRLSRRGNRIIYVPVGFEHWRDNILARLHWLITYPPRPVVRQPGVYELLLFNILPSRCTPHRIQSWVNSVFLRPALRRLAQQLDISRPILWFTFPAMSAACRHLDPRLIVYDCSDRWPECCWKEEQTLLQQADVVFATAHRLFEERKRLHPNTHLVPNAVDVEAYRRALLPETPIPRDVADLPRPLIGLVGAIKGKVDVPLLSKMARLRPQWSVVLVGPTFPGEVQLQVLESQPNVHILGYRDPAELPGYLKALDVALIPYVLNERTRAINPLKLYEYLAAGKPVVATALPELAGFQSLVKLAHGETEFVHRVELALEEDGTQLVQQRLEAVREHTWDRRVVTMERLIEPLLSRQSPTCPQTPDRSPLGH